MYSNLPDQFGANRYARPAPMVQPEWKWLSDAVSRTGAATMPPVRSVAESLLLAQAQPPLTYSKPGPHVQPSRPVRLPIAVILSSTVSTARGPIAPVTEFLM